MTREIVRGLWIGPRLSSLEQLSIRSFLQNGHPYHLYAYDPVEAVPEGTTVLRAEDVLPRGRIFRYGSAASYAGFANLFAYKVLLDRGGYWTDCDMVCLRPLSFAAPYVLPAERGERGSPVVNNCIIKSPAGSEFMRRACEFADGKRGEELRWGETGPQLITRLVRELGLQQYVAPPVVFCPIDHWEWWRAISGTLASRVRLRLLITRRTHAVHLWNERWRRNHADKDATYPPRSLYARLQARYPPTGARAAT